MSNYKASTKLEPEPKPKSPPLLDAYSLANTSFMQRKYEFGNRNGKPNPCMVTDHYQRVSMLQNQKIDLSYNQNQEIAKTGDDCLWRKGDPKCNKYVQDICKKFGIDIRMVDKNGNHIGQPNTISLLNHQQQIPNTKIVNGFNNVSDLKKLPVMKQKFIKVTYEKGKEIIPQNEYQLKIITVQNNDSLTRHTAVMTSQGTISHATCENGVLQTDIKQFSSQYNNKNKVSVRQVKTQKPTVVNKKIPSKTTSTTFNKDRVLKNIAVGISSSGGNQFVKYCKGEKTIQQCAKGLILSSATTTAMSLGTQYADDVLELTTGTASSHLGVGLTVFGTLVNVIQAKTAEEKVKEVGKGVIKTAVSYGSAEAGAFIGTILGGPIGTAVGAFAGGAIGGLINGFFG